MLCLKINRNTSKCIQTIKEPLILEGEGQYKLTSIKEIDGTKEFLAMDDEIKLCQNSYDLEDCLGNIFVTTVLDKCNCLPYAIRTFANHVSAPLSPKDDTSRNICIYFQSPICTQAGV